MAEVWKRDDVLITQVYNLEDLQYLYPENVDVQQLSDQGFAAFKDWWRRKSMYIGVDEIMHDIIHEFFAEVIF